MSIGTPKKPDPTPDEIAATCAAIQQGWSAAIERQRRCDDRMTPRGVDLARDVVTGPGRYLEPDWSDE